MKLINKSKCKRFYCNINFLILDLQILLCQTKQNYKLVKNIFLTSFLSAIFCLIPFGTKLFAQVKLPALFSNDMILQQKSEVAIWGWAKAGASVSVIPSWNNQKYKTLTDASGKWEIKIATPSAGGPFEIKISDGKIVSLSNILIGEVWICAGQSNMEMPMKGFKGQPVNGSNDAILKSKNKSIRLFTVPRAGKTEPQYDSKGQWKEASPETVANFSATGYYFGKLLNEVLDVPVGLICVSYGGSCIQAWMSKNTAQPFESTGIPQAGDSIKVPNRTPTALFNGMLHPVIGYGIKGAIWYQGETNYKEHNKYPTLFSTMVKEWRNLWGIGDFPFYCTQIAPFDYFSLDAKTPEKGVSSAYIREAQLKSMDSVPNSGMAVLMDMGEEKCIHPSQKEVGSKRLAYWALAKTYDIPGFGYASPSYKAIEIKDSCAVVSFNNIPNGLTSFGKELKCFEIAAADQKFYPAKAVLGAKSVTVSAPEVKNPVAVRYAFKDFVTGDLFSTEGLPVSSFRSDNW
jgi:sialate O-acetylesterase